MKTVLSPLLILVFMAVAASGLPLSGMAQRKTAQAANKTEKQTGPVLQVMSYNIRYDDKDAVDGWAKRKGKVVDLLRFHQADLIGVQEALHHQLKDLEAALPGFAWTGKGRDDGQEKGEFSAILYNKKVVELLESGTFWLSPTPQQPSKGWDASLPRVCSWAKFRHRDSGRTFYHFNTHYDHRGEQARTNSSALLVSRIKEIAKEEPVIVTGDFNVPPATQAYKTMVEGTSLKDAMEISQIPPHGPEGSFSGFDACQPLGQRIDYVFVKEPMQVQRYAHLTEIQNGRYISDHLAVLAEIKLPAQ
jgi:endonuclease/exonuclease/phosphatase family metal-dependent hydrolase